METLDDANKPWRGFKQFLLDIKCKTYFELGKAYEAAGNTKESARTLTEGIGQLIDRANHGHVCDPFALSLPLASIRCDLSVFAAM